VQEADQIAVLDAGRIVAVGTHQGLLGSSPEYRRLQALLQSNDR
jgi:ATP-binding cassette, subfamily B, bacterial